MKPPGVQEWGVAKRAGAVARNGTKLLGVGFFASLFGVTVTNVLVKVPAPCTCGVGGVACCAAQCQAAVLCTNGKCCTSLD